MINSLSLLRMAIFPAAKANSKRMGKGIGQNDSFWMTGGDGPTTPDGWPSVSQLLNTSPSFQSERETLGMVVEG